MYILFKTIGYVHATVAASAQGTLGLTGAVTTQTAAGNYISTIDAAIFANANAKSPVYIGWQQSYKEIEIESNILLEDRVITSI